MLATGSGVRIVVDPVDLRRCSSTLQDAAAEIRGLASRVSGHGLPEMPPEVAGRVGAEVSEVGCALGSEWSPFVSGAKELRVRALWAEISAQGGTVEGLSAAQLRDFVAFMKDGSMLDYATPAQRSVAGFLVGELYKGQFREPAKLIELADILRRNGHDANFAGAFIDEFGAANFASIPRVIQAMEWTDALTQTGSLSDWLVDSELGMELGLDGYQLERDPTELLSSFSMALATATYAGTLSRQTQRELAYDEDTWAVAQLLHDGRFGAEFLRDVFHSGVIAEIGRQGGNRSLGHQPVGYWPIGGRGDHPIATDQIEIILDALERNPAGVALALSDPVPEQFQFGVLQGNDNPIAILYDHMDWDDDGERFARMYDTGVRHWHGEGELERAYGMTQSLVHSTLEGERHLDPMTDALARDVAAHHIDDLHLSSSFAAPEGGDPLKAGWVLPLEIDGQRAVHLVLSKGELTDLMREFSDHSEANSTVLTAARDWQADFIRAHATEPAIPGRAPLDWAEQVGAFDGIVMNANDMERAEDFNGDNAKHRMVFSFLNGVTGALTSGNPVAGVAAGTLLTAVDDATSPSLTALIEANDDGKELITNAMHAAIAAGYVDNGVVDSQHVPSALLTSDDRLVAFDDEDLKEHPGRLIQFLAWMENDDEVDRKVGEAFDRADQARDNRDVDQ